MRGQRERLWPVGPQGLMGPMAPKGDPGPMGSQGPLELQGMPGPRGPTGPQNVNIGQAVPNINTTVDTTGLERSFSLCSLWDRIGSVEP